MTLNGPTQDKFTQAQEALTNLMLDYSQQIDTKKGSVVRELLIRPYAYLYAKIDEYVSNWLRRTSVAYLSQSSQTSNSTADLVASNYFVQRKQGDYATGIVTLTCNISQTRINNGAGFVVDGHSFAAAKTYIATLAPGEDTDTLGYIKTFQIGDSYKVNVPVVAVQPGTLQIPAGTQVTIGSYIPGAQSAELLSPITGGSSTQTDAQMMVRCKQRCGSAIGTLQAIRTKMQDAPVNVISCNASGSAQPGCFRDRYNNLALPSGGAVDVYVKTANQNSVTQLLIQPALGENNKYYICLTPADYPTVAGACRVLTVVRQGQDTSIGRYTVYYESSQPSVSDIGARNTSYQQIRIVFDSLVSADPVLVTLQFMPDIKALQDYMDSSYGRYLGQSCLVKASVPATVKVKCQLHVTAQPTETELTQIRQFITDKINSKLAGDYNLNMDQIAEQLQSVYPGIRLRLPYILSVELPMTNGGSYTFNTTDGVANLLFRKQSYLWAAQAYFFSTTAEFITLQVIS